MSFSVDEYGRLVKVLADGSALHLQRRPYNTILTVSTSADALTWLEGW